MMARYSTVFAHHHLALRATKRELNFISVPFAIEYYSSAVKSYFKDKLHMQHSSPTRVFCFLPVARTFFNIPAHILHGRFHIQMTLPKFILSEHTASCYQLISNQMCMLCGVRRDYYEAVL